MNTTKTVSLIFYKGSGTLRDKLIRLWTLSPYSHSEFGRSDGLFHSNDRFHFVSRTQAIEIDPSEWSICSLELPSEIVNRVERRQLRKNGTRYDWMGIAFSQVFRFGFHSKHRWFCSKSNADDLHYAYALMQRSRNLAFEPFLRVLEPIRQYESHTLAPRDLFELANTMEKIQKNILPKAPEEAGVRF